MRVDRARDKGGLLLEKRDGQPVTKETVDQKTRKRPPTFLGNIDAIACGVEAWVEENTGYSRKVTETTVEIARALGVPESEIKRWASVRSRQDTENGRVVQSLLARLQGGFCGADNRER